MGNKIAIISPEESPYSATFIKAHIDLLEGEIKHLFGVFFPTNSVDGHYQLQEISFFKELLIKRNSFKFPNFYRSVFLNAQLKKYFQKEGIQLVLAEFGPVGAEVCDVCKALNLPLIVHFHGYDAYLHNIFKKYDTKYKEMFEYATYLVVVSSDMKRQLLEKGAPADKIILNPYGPRDDFFQLKPKFHDITFLAVGRFVEKKAPHLTIQAFKKVHERIPEAKLKMIGDGKLLEKCKEYVKSENLEKSVIFLGALPHERILEVFENAYCFVQHSVVAPNGDSEGTPVAILEACAAALPVVATQHAGIKDVIVHGETGFLVEEQDVDSMSNYMIKIASDRKLAQQFGKHSRQRIKENYTLQNHISTLNQLVKDSLNKKVNATIK